MDFNAEVDKRFTTAEIDKIREFTLSDSNNVDEFLGPELSAKINKFYKEWTNAKN